MDKNACVYYWWNYFDDSDEENSDEENSSEENSAECTKLHLKGFIHA